MTVYPWRERGNDDVLIGLLAGVATGLQQGK
jgi:hypothetical protein